MFWDIPHFVSIVQFWDIEHFGKIVHLKNAIWNYMGLTTYHFKNAKVQY